ncbi:MAG: HAD-IA family hydrolase [Acidobacteriota bacterium]|nr:HAD-IA family hydrolase [Acidobacteriota bacterium]
MSTAPPPVRLLVFDLDGTLVDSRGDLAGAANELLQQCGAPPLDEAAVGRMVGEGASVLVQRVCAAAGLAEPADALARFLALYGRRLLRLTRPYDGIQDLLTRLDGQLPMAVLTNKPTDPADRLLAGLGLRRHFRFVIGGDGPFARKPDPEGLVALMAEWEVDAASTILVGDSPIDLRTARQAGARICLARYGFGFGNFTPGELNDDAWVIDTPLDLLAHLGLA